MFVMTDVVGSTALWEVHGDAMRTALEVHDGLVHGAIESAGGRVFKHTGDGMIAVFDDADAAVAGSLRSVHSLAGGAWGRRVRWRCGCRCTPDQHWNVMGTSSVRR